MVTATCERIAEAMDPSPLDGLKLFLTISRRASPLQTPGRDHRG